MYTVFTDLQSSGHWFFALEIITTNDPRLPLEGLVQRWFPVPQRPAANILESPKGLASEPSVPHADPLMCLKNVFSLDVFGILVPFYPFLYMAYIFWSLFLWRLFKKKVWGISWKIHGRHVVLGKPTNSSLSSPALLFQWIIASDSFLF